MKATKYVSFFIIATLILTGCGNSSKSTSAAMPADTVNSVKQDIDNKTVENNKEANNTVIKPETESINKEQSGNTNSNSVAISSNTNNVSEKDAVENKKIVVIDPGHANRSNLDKEPNAPGTEVMKIKDGGGATGIVTGTPEYAINMQVAVRLKELLEKKNFKVVMTKTENSQSLGNVERAKIGNEAKANLVIRIHCDSNDSSQAVGASMLVPDAINSNTKSIYKESKRCGEIVLNTLTNRVGMKNRGLIFSNDMTGFNWSEVPVILVEMGFLSNPEEDKLLSNGSYQEKLAKGLAEGIAEALK